LLVMLGLLWLVFRVGKWAWSPRVGLLAALFVAANPDLFYGVVYPLNDTTFTLLAFGCVVLIADCGLRIADWQGGPVGSMADADAPARRFNPQSAIRNPQFPWLVLGLLAGLLVLSKPSGAVLLAGGGAWLLWEGWRK